MSRRVEPLASWQGWGHVPDKAQGSIVDALLDRARARVGAAESHLERTPPRTDLARRNLRLASYGLAAAAQLGWEAKVSDRLDAAWATVLRLEGV